MSSATLPICTSVCTINHDCSRYGTRSRISTSCLVFSSRIKFENITGQKGLVMFDRTADRRFYLSASLDDSTHPDIAVEKESNELETNANKAQATWKKNLKTFKEEASKIKAISEEAYDMYTKQAAIVLQETSETLKLQAEMYSKQAMMALERSSETLKTEAKNARENFSVAAKLVSEKVYLSEIAKNSPDSIKDVVETFTAAGDLEEPTVIRDFYLGIPYGAFLAGGGFLSFMLTGSISAVRFGVILGSSLLALSVASLRSWKSGQSSELYIKGQAAIAAIIFINECRTFSQSKQFSTSLMVLISNGTQDDYPMNHNVGSADAFGSNAPDVTADNFGVWRITGSCNLLMALITETEDVICIASSQQA